MLPFKRFIREEYFEDMINWTKDPLMPSEDEPYNKALGKRPVGRPKRIYTLEDSLSSSSLSLPEHGGGLVEHIVRKKYRYRRHNTYYDNWFTIDMWPLIQASLEKNRFKAREAVSFLQCKYPANSTQPSLFDRLNESIVKTWLTQDGKSFCPRVLEAIRILNEPSTEEAIFTEECSGTATVNPSGSLEYNLSGIKSLPKDTPVNLQGYIK